MNAFGRIFVFSSLLAAAACGGQDSQRAALYEDELERDFAAAGLTPRGVVSPLEAGLSAPVTPEPETYAAEEFEPAPAPKPRAASAPRRSAPRRSTTASAPAPARQPQVITKRNTARDAALGAGAGAVIGGVAAGRGDRVKGAVIGAAAGGVVGAVIGHTVDKKTTVVY